MGDSILSVGEKSRDQLLVYSLINVNPGLINPKRLFNLGGYRWRIDDYWRSTLLTNKPRFSLIRGWHYHLPLGCWMWGSIYQPTSGNLGTSGDHDFASKVFEGWKRHHCHLRTPIMMMGAIAEGRLELGAVSWRDLEYLRSSGTSGNHLEIYKNIVLRDPQRS